MNFGATISETGQTEQSDSLEMSRKNRNLTARNEKNSACDFFSHSGNFDSCKKMREYREIAPENDPCFYKEADKNTRL